MTDWYSELGIEPQPNPWQSIVNVASEAVDNGVNYINNNPGKVYGPPPRQWPAWVGNSDSGRIDNGYDKGFEIPQMTSPNDTQFGGTPKQDWDIPSHMFDSYWTPTPPAPPDPEFTPLENWQQDIWRGTVQPPQQYQQGQETPTDAWTIMTGQPPPQGASW